MPLFRAASAAAAAAGTRRTVGTRHARATRATQGYCWRETIPAVRVANDCFPGGHFTAPLALSAAPPPSCHSGGSGSGILGSAICCCRLNGGGHFRTGAAADEGPVSGPPAGARPRLAVHCAPLDSETELLATAARGAQMEYQRCSGMTHHGYPALERCEPRETWMMRSFSRLSQYGGFSLKREKYSTLTK